MRTRLVTSPVHVWLVAVLMFCATRAATPQPIANRVPAGPLRVAAAMHHRDPAPASLPTPHTGLFPDRATSPMPRGPRLRAALLHLRPTCCAVTTAPFVLTSALRTMSTKPSLKAAEDFLSFVNASPTRTSLAVNDLQVASMLTAGSLSCREISQRAAGEGRLQAD